MDKGETEASEKPDFPIRVLNGLTLLPHPDDQPSDDKNRTHPPENIEMNLIKTKIFKAIANGSRSEILKVSREYVRAGKDPNLKDPDTGGNLLHHVVAHSWKFSDPEMLSIVYMLTFVDVEVDAQDFNGDTPLHCVVRERGAYRIMVALIRLGADTSIKNSTGMTMEDVLEQERPPGHEEMLHWYNKFRPGLWCELTHDKPDRGVVEKLLKSWCRLTTVKKGRVVYMKSLLQHDIQKTDILSLVEKHENTVELALALIGGLGFIVRKWLKYGMFQNVDVNAHDLSYQIRYPDYPECPQPLLAATWEVNSFDAVDVLMELAPETRTLWICRTDLIPRPFIFQILDNACRPRETKLIHRILEKTDVSVRNHLGHTLLFQAILNEEPLETIELLLRKHVNVGARDNVGRTARDLAVELEHHKAVKAIDNYVLQLIRDRDFPRVERLLLDGYHHLWNIKDSSGRTSLDIAKRFSSRQVFEIVRMGEPIQLYIKRVFRSVDEGIVDDLQKLLSCKKYASGLDLCGRTPLLKAMFLRRRGIAMKILLECSFTVNLQDSVNTCNVVGLLFQLGRSALHYAYLFIDDPDMIELLERSGANPNLEDWQGRCPKSYSQSAQGIPGFCQLKRETLDADLDIYIYRTNFEASFRTAIQDGDLYRIKELVSGLAESGDIGRYSFFLFECVDLCREDIAVYLLESGFKHDIYRSYVKCDPSDTRCAMAECNHCVITLKQRAVTTGCCRVVKLINRLSDNADLLQREATSLLHYGMM